ncbi:MAG: CRISPR-associated helicase Cas3' [Solirubrobacteraceae bacterium]|nr:CRISPR-associated helicase Cas3' [Solirubrobacteraceae bacterium]
MGEFWAKTGGGDEYLSVGAHLDDALAVGRRLWDVVLVDRQRHWIADHLRLDVDGARAWATFLVGVHDVGKITPTFQGLVPGLAERVVPSGLEAQGPDVRRERHDALGGAILRRWLIARGTGPSVASRLAAAISGHHGQLRSDAHIARRAGEVLVSAPSWRSHQDAMLEHVARETIAGRPSPEPTTAVVLALAGFVTVADWIASDAHHFPVSAQSSRPASTELAIPAVIPSAWCRPPLAPVADAGTHAEAFAELFRAPDGAPRPPRATQRAVIDAVADRATGRLLIIEDRTGSGKTEAAMWAVRRALEDGARGLYVGMPTRATADQLHARASAFLARLWPDAHVRPRLLHGMASVLVDPLSDIRPAGTDTEESGEYAGGDTDADAQAWFAAAKRGLLAPFAVGTIDQALLATMWVRHSTVRLWGLQGKVVVLDEVHAYDAYSSTLLARLVAWLAAGDATVVLLSATLPAARRDALTRAFRSGLTGRVAEERPVVGSRRRPRRASGVERATRPSAPYPRITIADRGGVDEREVTDDRPSRTLALRRLDVDPDRADEQVAARLMTAVATDGCVGVVCNTVAAAQSRYAMLRERVGRDVELLLLHARQRPCERSAIESRLLARLGPPSDPVVVRPRRMIVVATQVIEQSLDLDFDLLLSDVAPIDLLIQRAGRVHRHDRARPSSHDKATLELVDVGGDRADRPFLPASDRVYAESVLQRTRLALRDRMVLKEPDDLDTLIESVYGDLEPNVSEAEVDGLRRAEERDAQKTRKQTEAADGLHGALFPGPDEAVEPWNDVSRLLPEPDDPRRFGGPDGPGDRYGTVATTRWQERPSVSVVVLRSDELPRARYDPDRAQTRDLLARSLSLSQWPIVEPVLRDWRRPRRSRLLQPAAWSANAALRHHALVELDEDGRARVVSSSDGDVRLPLRLEPDLGVIVEDDG